MPRTNRNTCKYLRLKCVDDADAFIVRYTNLGDPYREGIEIGIENTEFEKDVTVMLLDYEAKQLRDVLLRIYPLAT